MLNKKRVTLLLLITFLVFFIPFLIFHWKVSEARNSIERWESEQKNAVELEKQKVLQSLPQIEGINSIFESNYKEYDFTSYSDTTVQFFIYSETLSKKYYDFAYLQCLADHSFLLATNKANNEIFENYIQEKEKVYNDQVRRWINYIGRNKFFTKKIIHSCSNYFDQTKAEYINEGSLKDFSDFLEEYNFKKYQLTQNEENEKLKLKRYLELIKSTIPSSKKSQFEQVLSNKNLTETSSSFIYSSNNLGSFTYSIINYEFDPIEIDKQLAYLYNDIFMNHSLRNGDMPYGYCYGTSNYGSAAVEVNAGPSDVLVSIRNANDQVVRHVFIASHRSYQLNVTPGSYSVHFYYGSGWNPYKYMADAVCGPLKGGFINGQQVSKDPNRVYLNSGDIMTYTLTQVTNGNFSTAGSSIEEAFGK